MAKKCRCRGELVRLADPVITVLVLCLNCDFTTEGGGPPIVARLRDVLPLRPAAPETGEDHA